jgi:hypothetical protein
VSGHRLPSSRHPRANVEVGFNLKAAREMLAAYLQRRRRVVGSQSTQLSIRVGVDALRVAGTVLCGWTLDRRR